MKGLSVGFTAVVNLYKKDPQCNSLQSPPSRTRTPPHSTGIDRRDKCNLRLTHRRSPLRRVRQCSQRSTSRLCQFHRLPRIRVTCHSCITRDPRWRCCRSSPAQSVSRTLSFPLSFAPCLDFTTKRTKVTLSHLPRRAAPGFRGGGPSTSLRMICVPTRNLPRRALEISRVRSK